MREAHGNDMIALGYAWDTARCRTCHGRSQNPGLLDHTPFPIGAGIFFVGAKVTLLGELPQGQPERWARVVKMVAQHDHEGFGGCTNTGACADVCPKEIPLDVINQLNKDLRASMSKRA